MNVNWDTGSSYAEEYSQNLAGLCGVVRVHVKIKWLSFRIFIPSHSHYFLHRIVELFQPVEPNLAQPFEVLQEGSVSQLTKVRDSETDQLPISESNTLPSPLPAYAERFPINVRSHLPSCLATSLAMMNRRAFLKMHGYSHALSANANQFSVQCTGLGDGKDFFVC